MNQNKTIAFNIFPVKIANSLYDHSNFSKEQSEQQSIEIEKQKRIFKIMFLQDSSKLLIIDIEKSYNIYKIVSQSQSTKIGQGNFASQLADSFEGLFVNGQSLILYLVEDSLYIENVHTHKTITKCKFKESKSAHSSIYEQQFKFRLFQDTIHHTSCLPHVLLFWKVSSLQRSENREIYFQLKVLILQETINQFDHQKNELLFSNLNSVSLRNIHFKPHPEFTKALKIESLKYLDFVFAFNHPFSYQIQGYNIEICAYSNTNLVKKKFSINSIYNQLVKDVFPLNQKLLVFTKHESMNLEELQQRENNEQQQNRQIQQDLKQNKYQMFKEDFKQNIKPISQEPFRKYNSFFHLGNDSYNFQEDERIDVYSMQFNLNQDSINSSNNQKLQCRVQNIKISKLFSSIQAKQLLSIIFESPNVASNINNMSNRFKQIQLANIEGNQRNFKKINACLEKQSLKKIYYQNFCTSKNKQLKTQPILNRCFVQTPLIKIQFSKACIYMKILDQFLGRQLRLIDNHFKKTITQQSNLSEDKLNQRSQTQIYQQQSSEIHSMDSFKELVISML